MLKFGATARVVATRAALGLGGISAVGGAGITAYSYSEQGLGFRREVQYWSVVSPVIFDYWWNLSSKSPKVQFQKMLSPQVTEVEATADNDQEEDNDLEMQSDSYRDLHERNAPRMYKIILDLGGLYVKLGQVLSVTALPIPNQYRDLFKELQSNVPTHEEFDHVIKPTLEKEFGQPLEEIFESFDEIPCGAASIGQAHKARLRSTGERVIVKVQYPDAKWQVPADIQCVGDFMNLCVYFGLIDESAAKLSFEEFSRQFLSELDYNQERQNLEEVHESSLDPKSPYMRRGVIVPSVFPDLCTDKVITMTYLPGPKFQEEAKRQLELLGLNTNRQLRDIVREATDKKSNSGGKEDNDETPSRRRSVSWQNSVARFVGNWIGVDSIFSLVRLVRKFALWSRVVAVSTIRVASSLSSLVPEEWEVWAEQHENAALQAARLDWTHEAVIALLDVHGYQILNQGLFNADPHPGNLLIVQDEEIGTSSSASEPKIGLIDFGQCKRLSCDERVRVAKFLLSVADKASDETVAQHFRELGIKTKNDSSHYLANFARLMFGSLQPEHLDRSWHQALQQEDTVLYFPNELAMVYRTSLLLRGLGMSLQLNVSVGEQWRHHAQKLIAEQGEAV